MSSLIISWLLGIIRMYFGFIIIEKVLYILVNYLKVGCLIL